MEKRGELKEVGRWERGRASKTERMSKGRSKKVIQSMLMRG